MTERSQQPSRKPQVDTPEVGLEVGMRLGQILLGRGLITEEQLKEALKRQVETHEVLGQILLDMGAIKKDDLNSALGAQAGMPTVDLDEAMILQEVVDRVSVSIATIYKVVPVAFEHGVLTVAMADPMNVHSLDDLRMMLGCDVKGAVSNEEAIERALLKHYGSAIETVESVIGEIQEQASGYGEFVSDATETIDLDSLEEMAESAPVRRLLNLVLLQAIKDQASDIHFEPFEDEFKIRYRIDGILYEMVPPPRHLALAISSRIKVMANLDIAERRLPQDGRIMLNIAGNPVDLRVSVLPTMFGESVVMRVLDRSLLRLDLDRIGMREDDLKLFRKEILKPNGIILVTGPTGCGKTTTLYCCLNEINKIDVKIITTEDPVEYDLEGIMQVQINEEIGLSFAGCLRHILRQDPDKILVGEIRDLETAEIAVQASLTGHLVFSTLHTNDAPGAITRWIEMGVEPYLITATLESINAQRLVRTICPKCRREYKPSEEMLWELDLTPEQVKDKTFYYGTGCGACNNTGYRGRTGIFELMIMSDTLRSLIMKQVSTNVIREAAIAEGMKPLRTAGLAAIYDGITTIEEVVRETLVEQE
jgi:type IV pilus assembly protein PilB